MVLGSFRIAELLVLMMVRSASFYLDLALGDASINDDRGGHGGFLGVSSGAGGQRPLAHLVLW